MLSYIPLAITFILGVTGVALKTRREQANSPFHQPTVGGWIVLALLGISLSTGIFLEAARQKSARLKAVSDSLKYVGTTQQLDTQLVNTKRLASASDSGFRSQLELANTQLAFLRHLVLMQYELAGVEVSWTLDASTVAELAASVLRYGRQPGTSQPATPDLIYVSTAVEHGHLDLRPTARSHSTLQVVVGRPQGLYVRQFRDSQLEWQAVEQALQSYLSERFEIELAPGLFLADLARLHWPCRVTLEGRRIVFTVDRPGVPIGELIGAHVTLWTGDLKGRRLPTSVRVRSTDPRISFDQVFRPSWTRVVIKSYQMPDDRRDEYANYKAGPFALAANVDISLGQVDSSKSMAGRAAPR